MATFTKVSKNGQIEMDFEAMEKEVCTEFAMAVTNAMRNPRAVIISEDCETLTFKEIMVSDGFHVHIIQANYRVTLQDWKVSKSIISKYDIKDLYNKFWGGETK